MNDTSNPYELLGVSVYATQSEIKRKYRKLARRYHPDINPEGIDFFKRITEAYKEIVEKAPDYKIPGSDIVLNVTVPLRIYFTKRKMTVRYFRILRDGTKQNKEISLNVPEVVQEDKPYVFKNGGHYSKDGIPGNLVVRFALQKEDPKQRVRTEGRHVYLYVPLYISEFVLGCSKTVYLYETPIELRLSENTYPNQPVARENEGLPYLENNKVRRGILYIVPTLEIPTELTEEHREIYRKLLEIEEK